MWVPDAEHEALEDHSETDPLEMAAKEKDLNYVKLDGEVGIIGNGAGLVMSTLDVVAYAGQSFGGIRPANFLDIGGGANADVMAGALEVINDDPRVKAIFINIFGGITRCDLVAQGVLGALERVEATVPIVVRLDGNNAAEGRRILDEAGIGVVEQVATMDDAARRAAERWIDGRDRRLRRCRTRVAAGGQRRGSAADRPDAGCGRPGGHPSS